jgi:hypothetical protein
MEATSAGAIPRRGSLRVDAYLGFTRSGEPVRIWSHLGYSSGNLKVFWRSDTGTTSLTTSTRTWWRRCGRHWHRRRPDLVRS